MSGRPKRIAGRKCCALDRTGCVRVAADLPRLEILRFLLESGAEVVDGEHKPARFAESVLYLCFRLVLYIDLNA